jgi:hypothetical protein
MQSTQLDFYSQDNDVADALRNDINEMVELLIESPTIDNEISYAVTYICEWLRELKMVSMSTADLEFVKDTEEWITPYVEGLKVTAEPVVAKLIPEFRQEMSLFLAEVYRILSQVTISLSYSELIEMIDLVYSKIEDCLSTQIDRVFPECPSWLSYYKSIMNEMRKIENMKQLAGSGIHPFHRIEN